MTTTILTIAAACAGVALGCIGSCITFMPMVERRDAKIRILFDMLEEAAIENDLLHAERKGRVKVYS